MPHVARRTASFHAVAATRRHGKPRQPFEKRTKRTRNGHPIALDMGIALLALRPPCTHRTQLACWSWLCACGMHGHHDDPVTRRQAADDHACVLETPCVRLEHAAPAECLDCPA
jgi:hypothetical protein